MVGSEFLHRFKTHGLTSLINCHIRTYFTVNYTLRRHIFQVLHNRSGTFTPLPRYPFSHWGMCWLWTNHSGTSYLHLLYPRTGSQAERQSIKSHETSHASTHRWINYTHEPTVTDTHFHHATCGNNSCRIRSLLWHSNLLVSDKAQKYCAFNGSQHL